MSHGPMFLLKTKRFLPYFATQFLGALNDNLFKNAAAFLIIFQLADSSGSDGQILVNIATGLFILPFFLFSAMAGNIADRMSKTKLMRLVKTMEIPIMGLAAYGFFSGNVTVLLTTLFLMGTQSSFFGPVKYSALPELMKPDELLNANALVEGGTFLAILAGTIAGGLLIEAEAGRTLVSSALLVCAGLGLVSSWLIPGTAAPAARKTTNDSEGRTRGKTPFFGQTFAVLRHAAENRPVFLSILGISWFWAVGATYLTQFLGLTKNIIGGDETVVTLLLATFTIGIASGSLLCSKLLKGEVSAKYVPFGALGIAIFSLDLAYAASSVTMPDITFTAKTFLLDWRNWRFLVDLTLLAMFGGIFVVPLYTILQSRSEDAHRSRNIAANNIMNALFIVVAALLAAGAFAIGASVIEVFVAIAIGSVIAAVYICKLLPQELFKTSAAAILRVLFKVRLRDVENLQRVGDKAVIVANHVSYLDGLLLAAFLPGDLVFAVDTAQAKKWWVRVFLSMVEAFPMDPTNPMATKSLIKEVAKGKRCVIFPEGRLTRTGALMKIYEGPGMIADKADAPIIPIRLDGVQHSRFTYLKGKLRQRWFPQITVTVLEPKEFHGDEGLSGRQRRKNIAQKLYDVMSGMMFATSDTPQTLFDAFLDARYAHGRKSEILCDVEQKPFTYDGLLTAGLAVGRALETRTPVEIPVGLLLPNTVGSVITLLGLTATGRIPAMLNFTAGPAAIKAALQAADIKQVVTSRRFIELGKLTALEEALAAQVELIYLEDIRDQMTTFDRLSALIRRPFAGALHRRRGTSPDDTAVILFTSGSEGLPKGVALSHRNIVSNCRQVASVLDFNPVDKVFNPLPLFHSFGLTGGLILPLLSGVPSFLYPSPLHFKVIPEMIYHTNATILFATDTFLQAYAKANSYDFYSLRYVFAGAERVKDETRRLWSERFGLRILEGYGATECAPVLAVNTPMHFKPGTVGRLLPGIEPRLEEVPGLDDPDAGRLFVRGPNIMRGYLKADKPAVLQPLDTGWYDTGDICKLDEDGFVTISGRAKRFAKIGGEMVSLTAIEALAAELWPDEQHVAAALPDPKKGEQIVLLTTRQKPAASELQVHGKTRGWAEIQLPKLLHEISEIPLLGSGKTDYGAVTDFAREKLGLV
ncbi:acyl-[ACP]--phospholipid O-acyltransferase [Denitrobaculum tricleocarpae]|uniref:Acyl-[ACP]--phospholipid O-acyltransferase n=1 Tax=Denitrobaculum tricleocarpae TaxID=2591009 RepID=A0A545TWL4_9PROT|nr:acyl-[ACP]--phospholipid O-acyltransferase [Denitrobaculum tricleocarpae]TQV81594.1 acyl-[ACP]--phospholipid O-acyltransferase [Denitrobaculum tricleocarpae]